MKTKLFITGLAFMALTTLAIGQNNVTTSQPQNSKKQGIAYVDANKNGICDNYENRVASVPGGKRNGNGKCCFQGQSGGMGQRPGNGMGPGRCRNRNFVDADKNGVCDFYEAASKK
jgi:hypothetical protein